jgi:hypothetical protein
MIRESRIRRDVHKSNSKRAKSCAPVKIPQKGQLESECIWATYEDARVAKLLAYGEPQAIFRGLFFVLQGVKIALEPLPYSLFIYNHLPRLLDTKIVTKHIAD